MNKSLTYINEMRSIQREILEFIESEDALLKIKFSENDEANQRKIQLIFPALTLLSKCMCFFDAPDDLLLESKNEIIFLFEIVVRIFLIESRHFFYIFKMI